MREQDDESLIESFLGNKSLAEVFEEYESISRFQEKVSAQSKELALYRDELAGKKVSTEGEKNKLVSFKSELGDQNKILAINKKEKTNLLTVTKNKETEYKKILAERQAEKDRFEKELFLFESQLKRAIDPNSFPSSGKGVFAWPLDDIFITQNFGRTSDSKRLYTSGTHNGVDFRASRGTRVLAVLNGVVTGTGNTDEQRGCYSYGKWVLIKHPNGLSSLYAHLDLIKVTDGQTVSTGEIIGYSGNTGYSTGPHLHLTVYASQGVEIQKYSSSKNCKNVTIPVANTKAYLDPMLYF
jgi:murein DD-endopeptidase MepM/ murein hydrolase activator NlpD